MPIVVNGGPTGMQQGSKPWRDLRSCFITGSQYLPYTRPTHMMMHKKAIAEKASHWTASAPEVPIALQRMFDWGHFHEDLARKQYTLQTIIDNPQADVKVNDKVAMMIDDEGMIAASPDGIVTVTNQPPGVIEIKCPTGQYFWKRNARDPKFDINGIDSTQMQHLYEDMGKTDIGRKYYEMDTQFRIGGKLENHYLQCLGNLHLSGAEWCDYIVYVPFKKWHKGKHMRVKRITREETEEDWERTREALVHAYKESHGVFTENLTRYLAEYEQTDFATGDA